MLYNPPIGGAANDPYVDANPATGVEGSPVPAAAIEDPQREIVAAIVAAGIAPDEANLSQLAQVFALKAPLASPALTGTPTAPTAAQFLRSLKLANTQWVKDRGIESVGRIATLTVNSTLGAGYAGGVTAINGAAGAISITLPDIAADLANTPGVRVMFINLGAYAGTVQRNGTDVIYADGGGSINSIMVLPGDTLTLEVSEAGKWDAIDGSARLKYSGAFSSLMGANGYKKFPDKNSPSGFFILQWATGSVVSGANAVQQTVTLPIVFPNGTLHTLVGTKLASGNGGVSLWTHLSSGAGSVVCYCTASGVPNDVAPTVYAVGY